MSVSPVPSSGQAVATWACLGIAAAGGLIAGYVFLLGRVRLRAPDLHEWFHGDDAAWKSPALAAGIRRGDRTAAVSDDGALVD